jgi:phenylacetate-CoA ligase
MPGNNYPPLTAFDIIRGSRIRRYYSFFRKTSSWSVEELLAYQSQRLRKLITEACSYSPWYRELFRKAGISPEDISTPGDLVLLPPLTRTDLRDHSDDILCKAGNRIYSSGSSSGTTGIPVRYHTDMEGYSAGVGAGYFIWSLSGWEPGKKSVHIWGNPQSVAKWNKPGSRMKRFFFRQMYVPSLVLNTRENFEDVVERIRSFRPFSIDGYTSSIGKLAEYVLDRGIRLDSLRVVFTTAENLSPGQLQMIEKGLAPVSDTYGCGEINSIAVKPAGSDMFSIIEPNVIVETEDN